jgi:glutathione synthase/RimK-type ligase-like ATP-grasp enzyme
MQNHVIVVESPTDRAWAEGAGTAMTAQEYVAEPQRFTGPELRGGKLRIINLSGDYGYLDFGYYCSLLAEARGHRVIPSVATISTLQRKTLYAEELPELNAALRRDIERAGEPPRGAFTLILFFGQAFETRYNAFARQVFDRLRCPLMRVEIAQDERWQIKSLKPLAPSALSPEQFEIFLGALEAYTRTVWTSPKRRRQPRYSLAVLYNPKEALPPSSPRTLKRLQQVGQKMGLGVELIERKDYLRLGEYDGLFIRETTSIDNHTFRFAKKAAREGLAVIDDPISILRCTNKVYLAELLQAHKLPAPRSLILDRDSILEAEALGFPLVLKIPDGSFSRGVVKAHDRAELQRQARDLLKRSELILAQEYMYTEYDWRVGVLGRKPLFVSQYMMAGNHWQIIRHEDGGKFDEGGFRTLPVEEAPAEVVQTALKAANLVGDGLYGVDLKQNERGVFVIEINDNPNLERGVEDKVLGDALYETLLQDFVRRIEAR